MFIKEAESEFTPFLLLCVIVALITRVDNVQDKLSEPTFKKYNFSVFFTKLVSTVKPPATKCSLRNCKLLKIKYSSSFNKLS